MPVLRALVLLFVTAPRAGAQGRPCDPATPLGPSHDLYCIELVPAPGILGAAGRVELGSPSGPFTVAVTADGHQRFFPVVFLSGLPAGIYVAWAAPPQMDSLIKLGPVKNGSTVVRAIDLDKFVILISSERSARVRAPHGRMILRGQSPSTRPFPPDVLEFSLGQMAAGGGEAGHHEHQSSDWPMPPVPQGLTMLPAEMALRPDITPYLPPADSTIPLADRHEVLRLKDGDIVDLEAIPVRRRLQGQTFTMFGYNGQYPGPLIEVARGSEIMVRFTNLLPEPSTIHWHGIRLDNRFDGVSELSEPPVAAGDRFTYTVRFPDAGIYWYHPHVREDVQQELGLYGNILVRPSKGAEYSPANREAILMLDDLLVGDGGLIPLGQESPTHALMGRFGNLFLVNGEPGYRLSVRRGEVVRFYLTNASNARTLNLSFPGARMKVVASDAGRLEQEAWVASVVIAPAERYIVYVRFDRPGTVPLLNRVRGLDHLFGRFFPEVDTLGVVTVAREPVRDNLQRSFARLRRDTATRRALEPYRRFLDNPPDQTLVLTLEAHGLPFITERLMQLDSIYFAPVEWAGTMPMMNWASTGRQVRWVLKDPATGQENMDIAWRFHRGDPVKLRLVNERRAFHGMQHPIHVHGQRFLVLAVNGVPNQDLGWKDTVLVPAGAVVDILLDTANPGEWMLHCHIAEHLSAGMMMHFTVD